MRRLTDPGRRRRLLLLTGAVLVVALVAASGIGTLLAVHDLDRRVDRLGFPATPTNSEEVAASDASNFCLAYPLVGRLTISTGSSLQQSMYLGGDIAGFPANHEVSLELWDTTLIPSRLLHRIAFSADAYGAVHLGELSVGSSSHATRVFFREGTSARDLELAGPPASPC